MLHKDLTFTLNDCTETDETCFKVLELYSGIGGMHTAFHACKIPHQLVAAMDINTTTNSIYAHNFLGCTLQQRNIQSITVEELNELNPDVITMSPPCQPFTRQGLKKDVSDERTASLLHVLKTLSKRNAQVPYILLENVKGFETSEARSLLLKMLKEGGYDWREFLLTPTQFGIPNSRLRYYLLAKSTPFCFPGSETEVPQTDVPCLHDWEPSPTEVESLEGFLEGSGVNMEEFLLNDTTLAKFSLALDIVDKFSKQSCCFTKGYGRYIVGTGSVLQSNTSIKKDSVYRNISGIAAQDPQNLLELKSLELRYFSPREICNLMHFPQCFKFPKECTPRQRYQALGNSVNVYVVSYLLKVLLHKCVASDLSNK